MELMRSSPQVTDKDADVSFRSKTEILSARFLFLFAHKHVDNLAAFIFFRLIFCKPNHRGESKSKICIFFWKCLLFSWFLPSKKKERQLDNPHWSVSHASSPPPSSPPEKAETVLVIEAGELFFS